MTYLQLVNSVLRRLREDQVASVSQNSYSALIGDFVNDAKALVEVAWPWNNLRTEVTVGAVSPTFQYTLTGAGSVPQVINVINDTSNTFMYYKTPSWFDNQFKNNTPATGSPEFFTFRGLNGDDSLIDVYPIPDASYTLLFNVVVGLEPLVNNSDTLLIPAQPVIQTAYAMALRERGETGGQSGAEQFVVADAFLADAIAMDASKNPEQLVWRTV
jgi:hypothetical protein